MIEGLQEMLKRDFDKKYGARSLRRAIQKEVEDYISTES